MYVASMEPEKWRDIPGVANYQASSLGRIRYVHVLAEITEKRTGYKRVSVHRDEGVRKNRRAFVAALVAAAFIGPKPEGMTVNHISGKKADNRPENLEYITQRDNIRHSFKLGNRTRFFTEEQMDVIADQYFDEGLSATAIARLLVGPPYEKLTVSRTRSAIASVIHIWRSAKRNGRKNPHEIKLDLVTAEKIRRLYATGGVTQRQLATLFDCAPGTVCRIVAGLAWKNETRRGKHSKGNPNFGKYINELTKMRREEAAANHPIEMAVTE